ncbi:MAG: glycosyltransferase family 2 protein [Gemmatimonadetes bacterium]|nr:glycosyltransferase family 2 protein [Gemmatimonadota bacterium]
MNTPRISVCMIAQNEAARIERALRSVAWADEIVVIDGGSTDDTVARAEACGARVEVHPWPGNFAVQIQRSLDATGGDWVFRIDADEAVTPELAEQLQAAVRDADPADAYRVRRKNYFLGRWIRHGGWWPDPQLRLVRRDIAAVRGAPGHETLHAEGRIRDLDGALEHDTHPSVAAALARVERYSNHLAPDRAKRRRITPWRLFAHPAAAFLRKYLVQSGWRDGTHGFLIAGIHAMVKFSVYAKAWEIQRNGDTT